MDATLKFNLDDPDGKMDHYRCIKSEDMTCVLFEIEANLQREIVNTIEHDKSISKYDAVAFVFQRIAEIYEDNGLRMDELIR